MREPYENFKRVSDACASTADYDAFADLFTEDCTYVEHVFGEMHGREEVRSWIVPLMKLYPNDQMVRYTHDWVLFDEEEGRVVSARTHMADPGDGSSLSATNWTMITYAGDGLFSREEDIYNPANFGKLLDLGRTCRSWGAIRLWLFLSGSGGLVGAKQLPAVDTGGVAVVPGDANPPRADKLRVEDAQRLRRCGQRPDRQAAVAPGAARRARAVLA